MSRENRIQSNVKKELEKFGRRVLVRIGHGSEYTVTGDPDVYGCVDGRAYAIELKQPGERARPEQIARLRQWAKAGAITGVATGPQEALHILAPALAYLRDDPPEFKEPYES